MPVPGSQLRQDDFLPGTPPLVVWGALMYFEKRGDPTTNVVLKRLVHDRRMLDVWRQLQRRRRNGSGYLYPARREYFRDNPALATAPREQVQDMALGLLFGAAITSVHSSVITKTELKEVVDNYSLMAARLRQDRQLLAKLKITVEDELRALDPLIAKCEDRAREIINETHWLVVDRHRGDDEIRAYLTALAMRMLELFETVPRGTLAKIANVVLDREVSTAMAREAHRRAVERAQK
jgi:hypothetical protein